MLCYFNVQICMAELIIQVENTILNTICFGLGSLRDAAYLQVIHDLTTQLLIIITALLTPNLGCNV